MSWRDASFAVWGLLALAIVGLQVVAWTSRGARIGLATLVRSVSARRVGRVALALGWMWLGWHAFAR